MKSLLDCHSKGLHSFPVSFDNGLYKRIFYAEPSHLLWKIEPIEIAIHPHHVDIKITVLDGTLYNCLYEKDENGQVFNTYQWDSVILNGKGGFRLLGSDKLYLTSKNGYTVGETIFMKACELHTVFVEKGNKCAWLIEEEIPTCEYFPINYSNSDLTKWTSKGLYRECSERTKNKYIKKYLPLLTN